MKRRFLLPALVAVLTSPAGIADVRLPAILSHHMVLKKAEGVPIWGKADPGESVTVTMGPASAKATAGADGSWEARLDLSSFGQGPFEMIVEGKNKLSVLDVVVGEVWVASGQSNMEWTVSRSMDAEKVIAESANPLLRQFLVKKNAADAPQKDTEGAWVAASPETTGNFSAVGYFFARAIQRELGVPVGLIHTSWGGTPSEAWTSQEAIARVPKLKASSDKMRACVTEHPATKKAFVEAMDAFVKAHAREDKPTSDPALYAGPEVSSEGWLPVKLPGKVAADGLPETGVIWLRNELTLADKPADKLPLQIAVDGFESVYWNGKLLKQTTFKDFPGAWNVRRGGVFDIPASDVNAGKNVLALRLYAPAAPALIPSAPKAGSQVLEQGWLAKAEVAFPPVDPAKIPPALQLPAAVPSPQGVASFLFDGMIRPILPYAISGVIWYQGESNAGRAHQYRTAFPLMISDWRQHWNQGDFPFYFCQLANFLKKSPQPGESAWAELREAQTSALALPNTGQAILLDLGESEDIHPRNKLDVGERLARIALAKDYGKPVVYSGPVYDSMKVENGKAILSFKAPADGLAAAPLPSSYSVQSLKERTAPLVRNSPSSELEGFAICGEDKRWVWANAKIQGDQVAVWSDQVPTPVAVRYAWSDNPTCNLTNAHGLPAGPFRTDDFPPTTLNSKY